MWSERFRPPACQKLPKCFLREAEQLQTASVLSSTDSMKSVVGFYLLVLCGAAESFTEKSVDLGLNVTLPCEVAAGRVFWFLMKPSEPPVLILHSYSPLTLDTRYSNPTFSKTFSLQHNSSLFIHNISTNELGVYFCIVAGSPPTISIGIRLSIRNHSAESQTRRNETPKENNQKEILIFLTLFIASVIINCAVAVAAVVRCCKRSTKTRAQDPGDGPQLHQDTTSPVGQETRNPLQQKPQYITSKSLRTVEQEYAEVKYNASNRPVRMSNVNSTYALLNPANP